MDNTKENVSLKVGRLKNLLKSTHIGASALKLGEFRHAFKLEFIYEREEEETSKTFVEYEMRFHVIMNT
jgi:hypothetical protein